MQNACYYAGDLEGNDARRTMGKDMIVLNETHCYSRMSKPNEVSLEEIETARTNYSRLRTLMDSVLAHFILREEM